MATAAPSSRSTGDDVDRAAHDRAGEPDPITAPADDAEPVPMSFDRDASDRSFDRLLACLGLLDDAAPLFGEGSSVPAVGVLLALPCLIESGLLRISHKLYGEIGPAFYGLRTTLLTLLFMALLRIKRPEHLKECDPAAFGRLLGLDRAPEVRPESPMRRVLFCWHTRAWNSSSACRAVETPVYLERFRRRTPAHRRSHQ